MNASRPCRIGGDILSGCRVQPADSGLILSSWGGRISWSIRAGCRISAPRRQDREERAAGMKVGRGDAPELQIPSRSCRIGAGRRRGRARAVGFLSDGGSEAGAGLLRLPLSCRLGARASAARPSCRIGAAPSGAFPPRSCRVGASAASILPDRGGRRPKARLHGCFILSTRGSGSRRRWPVILPNWGGPVRPLSNRRVTRRPILSERGVWSPLILSDGGSGTP